jgi:hypothetical protein
MTRKGSLTPGARRPGRLRPRGDLDGRRAALHHRHPVSPYHGRELTGRAVTTYLRGEVVDPTGSPRPAPATRCPVTDARPRAAPRRQLHGLIDLAAKRLGGMVLHADDEFFAAKENLLEPTDPRFDPEHYGDRGKEMDGWETRRRRDLPGADRCVVRLGVAGVVEAVVVDTAHFRGNYPDAFALEGCVSEGARRTTTPSGSPSASRPSCAATRSSASTSRCPRRATHVRFSIIPDGGVARLRMLGRASPTCTGPPTRRAGSTSPPRSTAAGPSPAPTSSSPRRTTS